MNYIKKDWVELKRDGLVCRDDDLVGSVLTTIDKLNGSKLVFDDQQNFLGILSVYHSVYLKQIDPETKAKHAAVKPLKVSPESSIYEIAEFMAGERIYTLPVFDGEKMVGIVSEKEIAEEIWVDKSLTDQIELTAGPAATCGIDSTVEDVYPLLKQKEVEEVVVVDQFGKAEGVVSRADLKHAFIHPSGKQRFGKNANRPTDWAFDTEKNRTLEDPIRNYFSPIIEMVSEEEKSNSILIKLLKEPLTPIVVTNKASQPVAMVTFRDILTVVGELGNKKPSVNLIIKKPSSNVSEAEFGQTLEHLDHFAEKMNHRLALEKIEATVEEPKYPTHKTAVFNTTLIIVPYSKGQYVAQATAWTYFQSMQSAMKQIEKQFQRDHVTQSSHTRKSLSENSLDQISRVSL